MKQNSSIRILFLALLLTTVISDAFAEGSKDLYPAGATGKRASLMSRDSTRLFDLFPTLGTMKVYVKAGETLYVGSSAQGVSQTYEGKTYIGTIKLRAPNGDKDSTGTGTSIGRISNRAQELIGPNRSGVTNGYTPYTKVVTAAQEGIWEIDFIAPTRADTTSVPAYDVDANANWIQQKSAMVVAWDVSVISNADPTTPIPGRLFCNTLNLNIEQQSSAIYGWYSTLYILTNEGFVYRVKANGQNGGGYNFFVNNKGIQDKLTGTANTASNVTKTWKNGQPAYKSIAFLDPISDTTFIYDPRLPDNGNDDITHKIFYNKPSTDLPPEAYIRYNDGARTTTWLRNIEPEAPVLSDLRLFGYESGTENLIGPNGANITFNSTVSGRYSITITAPGYTTRILAGDCEAGSNTIYWDGNDGAANPFNTNTTLKMKGLVTVGEIHFPMNDVENNPAGIIIELTDVDYELYVPTEDQVYWNDPASIFTSIYTPANPKENLTGLPSNTNGHKWGSNSLTKPQLTQESYGNNKLIDTWTLIKSSTDSCSIPLIVKSLDLSVDAITSNISSVTIGGTVTFTVTVSNEAGAYVDAVNSKFNFTGPDGFIITSHTFTTNIGTGSINGIGSYGSNTFSTNLNLTKGGTVTYTITGTINAPITIGSVFDATASIIRPADIRDVDLSNNIKTYSELTIVNQPPVAAADLGTVPEDTILTVALPGVLSNDTDADVSDILTVTMIRTGGTEGSGTAGTLGTALNGTYGTLTIYTDGSYIYNANNSITLAIGETRTDIFNYTVSDGIATDTATLTITITENNSVPTPVILDIVPEPEPYIFQ